MIERSYDISQVQKGCNQGAGLLTYKSVVLSVPYFKFDSEADFQDESKWLDAIAAGYLFPLRGIVEITSADKEPSFMETGYNTKINTLPKRRGAAYRYLYPTTSHVSLQDYNDRSWRAFYIDQGGKIIGTLDGSRVRGVELSLFYVEGLPTPSPQEAVNTTVHVQEADAGELDRNIVAFKPAWNSKRLEGVLTCVLSAGELTTSFTATVTYNGEPLSGLTSSNFELEGGSVAVSSFSEVSDGVYSITPSSLDGFTCQVVPTVENLFQSNSEDVGDAYSLDYAVVNSGGGATTDWTDSNSDGLADGYSEFAAYAAYATGTIVTGNGFTGNAQRYELTAAGFPPGGTMQIFRSASHVIKANSELRFKYRADAGTNLVVITDAGTHSYLVAANTGDALQAAFDLSAVAGETITEIRVSYFVSSLNNFFEVDEIEIYAIT